MATTAQINGFISEMGGIAQSVASSRTEWVLPSVCVAQACLETGYGTSTRMMVANAPFGIKATASWTGKVYDTVTHEVYSGVTVTENACFRAYDSVEEAVIDYMDLICGLDRYSGAVCNSSPKNTITAIYNGGYATDPDYVSKIMSIITSRNLTAYDTLTSGYCEIVSIAESQIGMSEPSGDDKYITYYNNQTGIGFNSTVSWCAIFVTWCARQAGVKSSIIPTFASCDIGMNWFIDKGQWHYSVSQGGSYIPKQGDIVFYSNGGTMSDSTHVGIVDAEGSLSTFTAIEGNTSDPSGSSSYDGVYRKSRNQAGSYVLGFATPAYVDPVGTVNDSSTITGTTLTGLNSVTKIHKVVTGDTLTKITKKYGSTVNDIVNTNIGKYP